MKKVTTKKHKRPLQGCVLVSTIRAPKSRRHTRANLFFSSAWTPTCIPMCARILAARSGAVPFFAQEERRHREKAGQKNSHRKRRRRCRATRLANGSPMSLFFKKIFLFLLGRSRILFGGPLLRPVRTRDRPRLGPTAPFPARSPPSLHFVLSGERKSANDTAPSANWSLVYFVFVFEAFCDGLVRRLCGGGATQSCDGKHRRHWRYGVHSDRTEQE